MKVNGDDFTTAPAPTTTTNKGMKSTSSWPPGFRFHPTDEELVLYYLKRKICRRRLTDLAMIGDVYVYKCQPWDLPEKSVLRSRDKQWYFFSPRDRKYPNGSRSNRATSYGYWKATGKDRTITHNSRTVGNKKTLVYYHGRAPKGERTDWVMHEYTLDDRELVSCNQYVQEYYALYKLFKKSGCGPKNGEDYGAPFREEDWEEEEGEGLNAKQLQVDSVSGALPNYHLEQVLLQLSTELDIIQPDDSQCGSYVPEVQIEEEVQSDVVGLSSCAEVTSVQHTSAWWEHGSGNTSFQIAPSTSVPHAQTVKMPEVTSLIGSEQGQLKTDVEFLEIKDFDDPCAEAWSMEDNSNNGHIPKLDELYDPYEYFDAQMYLAEALGPVEGTTTNLYSDGFGDEILESRVTTELWTHEQDFSVSTALESNQGATTSVAASGVVNGSGSVLDIGGESTQEPNSCVASPSDYWFSSALSAFLDSVPSSPAMAAENPFISKALQRVSSFRSGPAVPGTVSPTSARGNNNSSSLFVSFLVGLGAVLWVLIISIGVKVIKGLWSRLS